MIAIGLDPGYANLGFAVVEILPKSERVLDAGVIRTKPADKRKKVFASSDNIRRMRELAAGLSPLFWLRKDGPPAVVCTEAQSWGFQNQKTHGQYGMAWGVIVTVTTGLPLLEVPVDDLKRAVVGSQEIKSVGKKEVEDALRARYSELGALLDALPKGKREHAADAVGSVVACLDTEIVKALRR